MSSFSFKVKVVGSADPVLVIGSDERCRFFGGRAFETEKLREKKFARTGPNKAVDDSSSSAGGVPIWSSL